MTQLKNIWFQYTKIFGRSLLHPQFIKKTIEYKAVLMAKKYGYGRLVDIGCGRFPYKKDLSPFISEYVGVDHPKLSKMYDSVDKPDVLADACDMPFQNNSFETAICFQVLEYIEKPESLFKEAHRILKSGGKLILSVPLLYPLHDMPYDRARYTKTAIGDFAKNAGFAVVSLEHIGGFVEFWLQSLSVFLLKSIASLLRPKKQSFSLIFLPFLIIITPFIVIISNLIVIVFRSTNKMFIIGENYFPSEVLLVAEKK